jgi:hypothetical protein
MFRSPLVVVLFGATCITALHGQQASLMTKPGIASSDDELVVAAGEWLRALTPSCGRDR